MKHKYLILLFFIQITNISFSIQSNDLSVIGLMKFADGLGRLSIYFIDMLAKKLKISYIPSKENYKIDPTDIPANVNKVLAQNDLKIGKVALYTDFINVWKESYISSVDRDNVILFAYSMLESDVLPKFWVDNLNNYFDGVIVPDPYIKDVYKSSGVEIPIFNLPHPLYLDEFLSYPEKKSKSEVFTFGMSAGIFHRKNQKLLVEAFAEAFGNNPKIQLKLHGRVDSTQYDVLSGINDIIRAKNLNNITFIHKTLTHHEYIDFMKSLDCYVFLSKGEGFSITPREALALSIPCILTKNTSHLTICNTGFVREVECPILEPAYFSIFGFSVGYQFDCRKEDVKDALKDVYENYSFYLLKAKGGRKWVTQYLEKNLVSRYLNLFKPKRIRLANDNFVTKKAIYTNSEKLRNKYARLFWVK